MLISFTENCSFNINYYLDGIMKSDLDGDVPRRASYGVSISQLIRFARVCNHVTIMLFAITAAGVVPCGGP